MHHTSSSRRPIVTRTLAVAFIAWVVSIAGPRVQVGAAEYSLQQEPGGGNAR